VRRQRRQCCPSGAAAEGTRETAHLTGRRGRGVSMKPPKLFPPVCVGAPVTRTQRQLARHLRKNMTDAERRAWAILRRRGVLGFKFRRQQYVRGCIVDFYCPQLRLALEIDGGVHDDPVQARDDVWRDESLAAIGVRPPPGPLRRRTAWPAALSVPKLPPTAGGGSARSARGWLRTFCTAPWSLRVSGTQNQAAWRSCNEPESWLGASLRSRIDVITHCMTYCSVLQ